MNLPTRHQLLLLAAASLVATATIAPSSSVTSDSSTTSLNPDYVALEPQRLLDTRSSAPIGVDDATGTPTRLNVTGRAGLPDNGVAAVALNVTIVNATAAGYATVFNCDEQPTASNLNFGVGDTIANLAVTGVSGDGEVCIFVRGRGDLLVDVLGYFPTGAGYSTITPTRLVDTRSSAPLAGGDTLTVPVTDHHDIPADATAVKLTLAAVEAGAAGFATVYPCGARPEASNLNFTAGQTIANSVITALSPAGEICIHSNATIDVLVDITGYLDTTASLQPAAPHRIVDTRRSGMRVGTPDGDGDPLEITVGDIGRDGRARLGAVAMNLTVVDALDAGHLTVYPCGTRPDASNLNFAAGQTIANSVIAPVSESGTVCIHVRGRVHLLVDSTSTIQEPTPDTTPPPTSPPPTTTTPVPDHDGPDPVQMNITAARQHTCALLPDGRIKCWGHGSEARLGLGDTSDQGTSSDQMGDDLPFVDLGTDVRAESMTDGRAVHTCIIDYQGRVKCWGRNGFGELGIGDTTNRGDGPDQMGDALPFVNLGDGRTATRLTVGEHHTCAILNNDDLKCWGWNNRGQLGLGDNREATLATTPDQLPAIDLGSGRHAVDVSAGDFHTCALLDDGSVKCWGQGASGRLGLGDQVNRGDDEDQMGDNLPAVNLGAGRTAIAIASGRDHTCAILNNNDLKCWGSNGSGRLGYGDTTNRGGTSETTPDQLPAIDLGSDRHAVAVSLGSQHTCALLDNGSVKCWGNNGNGRLGLGDTTNRGGTSATTPDQLPAIDLGTGRTAVTISAGADHTCAILDDDSIKCWGRNENGRLGLGDTTDRGSEADQMGDALPAVRLVGPSA